MALADQLAHVMRRPGMWFQPVGYDTAVAFLAGYDLACNGGVLVGFKEWLLPQLGYGSNRPWCVLARWLVMPPIRSKRQSLDAETAEAQRLAVERLFRLLEDFLKEREQPEGIRRVYLTYQQWLKTQEWYGPGHPDYFEEGPKKKAKRKKREGQRKSCPSKDARQS
jgi:hypothetical protein